MNQQFEQLVKVFQQNVENMTKVSEMNMNLFNSLFNQAKDLTETTSKAKTPEDLISAGMSYSKKCQEDFQAYNKNAQDFFQNCQKQFNENLNQAAKNKAA